LQTTEVPDLEGLNGFELAQNPSFGRGVLAGALERFHQIPLAIDVLRALDYVALGAPEALLDVSSHSASVARNVPVASSQRDARSGRRSKRGREGSNRSQDAASLK